MQIRTSHFVRGLLITVERLRLPFPSTGIGSTLSPSSKGRDSQPRPITWLKSGILKAKDDQILCDRKPEYSEVVMAVVATSPDGSWVLTVLPNTS